MNISVVVSCGNLMNKDDRNELLGQLMDQIEDHIVKNTEGSNDAVLLSGISYDNLKERLETTLENWGLIPRKNEVGVVFLLLGPEDSGINELIKALKASDWNVVTDSRLTGYDGIQAIHTRPECYFDILKDLEEKGIMTETLMCVPEHGMDKDDRFIWASEEDRDTFEPIIENLVDTESKAYDFIRIQATDETIDKNRSTHITEYMQHTRNIYRNFNRILDRMLDDKLIFSVNDNRNHIKIKRENEPNAFIHRQVLISNLVRESDEMAGELMQLILYYLSNCEL